MGVGGESLGVELESHAAARQGIGPLQLPPRPRDLGEAAHGHGEGDVVALQRERPFAAALQYLPEAPFRGVEVPAREGEISQGSQSLQQLFPGSIEIAGVPFEQGEGFEMQAVGRLHQPLYGLEAGQGLQDPHPCGNPGPGAVRFGKGSGITPGGAFVLPLFGGLRGLEQDLLQCGNIGFTRRFGSRGIAACAGGNRRQRPGGKPECLQDRFHEGFKR